jgi:hypothetical protein
MYSSRCCGHCPSVIGSLRCRSNLCFTWAPHFLHLYRTSSWSKPVVGIVGITSNTLMGRWHVGQGGIAGNILYSVITIFLPGMPPIPYNIPLTIKGVVVQCFTLRKHLPLCRGRVVEKPERPARNMRGRRIGVAGTAGIPPEDILAVRNWRESDRLTDADRGDPIRHRCVAGRQDHFQGEMGRGGTAPPRAGGADRVRFCLDSPVPGVRGARFRPGLALRGWCRLFRRSVNPRCRRCGVAPSQSLAVLSQCDIAGMRFAAASASLPDVAGPCLGRSGDDRESPVKSS